MSNARKNFRRMSITVTAQTKYNLGYLAQISNFSEIGQVVDKLTREKMLTLRNFRGKSCNFCGKFGETSCKSIPAFDDDYNPTLMPLNFCPVCGRKVRYVSTKGVRDYAEKTADLYRRRDAGND